MLEPVTATVVEEGYGIEWIQFTNGHKLYFCPTDLHHHGYCDSHKRNCLATLTFTERWALQHAERPEPVPLNRAQRLAQALRYI